MKHAVLIDRELIDKTVRILEQAGCLIAVDALVRAISSAPDAVQVIDHGTVGAVEVWKKGAIITKEG